MNPRKKERRYTERTNRQERTAPEAHVDRMQAAYSAYTEAMQKAGVMVGVDRLQGSSTASTVRIRGGKTEVIDGPCRDKRAPRKIARANPLCESPA